MRFLIMASMLFGAACAEEKKAEDPCERASENARRLVMADEEARTRYGETPYSAMRCKQDKTSAQIAMCMGYASSVRELEACSPNALRRIDVARE